MDIYKGLRLYLQYLISTAISTLKTCRDALSYCHGSLLTQIAPLLSVNFTQYWHKAMSLRLFLALIVYSSSSQALVYYSDSRYRLVWMPRLGLNLLNTPGRFSFRVTISLTFFFCGWKNSGFWVILKDSWLICGRR